MKRRGKRHRRSVARGALAAVALGLVLSAVGVAGLAEAPPELDLSGIAEIQSIRVGGEHRE